ncbi:MAG: potassium-transporting ATPase subunit C [Acidimicrobiales bacterium]
MLVQLRRSIIVSAIFFVLLGLVYPLVTTGLAQVVFPHQANGSLTSNGSTLIGQRWSGRRWFHGRADAFNAMASGASNLGPNSKALEEFVAKEVRYYHHLGVNPTASLVTGSGSGLDPDVSVAGAYAQVGMVAKANGLSSSAVSRLVASQIVGQQLGFLGSQYINVLSLNEALTALVHHTKG